MAAPSTRNIIPLLPSATAAGPVETTISVTLAGQTRRDMVRREPFSRLSPPAVFEPALLGSDPRLRIKVVLAGRTRAEIPRHAPHYFLRPPAVLDTRPAIQTQIYVVGQATLRAVEKRRTRSFLTPPIVAAVVVTYPGPQVHLARIRPPRTQTDLRPPTVLQTFSGPRVFLTRIRPRKTRWFLGPPTTLQVFQAPKTPLVRTRPRPTTYFLNPPATLEPFSVELREQTISRSLVRIRPPKTRSFLRPPTVIRVPSVEQEQQTIKTSLARIRPPAVRSRIEPPTVLTVFEAAKAHLTRIRPPKIKSVLRPPAVVRADTTPTQDQVTIQTWLVRIRPRRPTSFLKKPATLEPYSLQLLARTIRVDLARIRPRKVRFFLRAPVVVAREIEDTLLTVLAPHARRRGKGVLRPPQALRVFTGARVYLTRIRPRRTITRLRPPTKLAPVETQIRVTLAPHARRPGRADLRPPTAVRYEQYPVSVTTTRIRPPRTHSVLRPPATLVPFSAQPISVTLVRIRPPAVRNILFEPSLAAFVPPRGKVCGFDSTSTAVCFGEIVTQIECGFTSTPTRVTGSSSARSRISGQTGSRTRTVGTDQEAT